MQKTINKIQELTIHQHKSIIIFIIADDCFFLDVNTKNFDFNFNDTLSKISYESIKLVSFLHTPSIVPTELFDKKYRHKYLETNVSNIKNIEHDLSIDERVTVVYSTNELIANILDKKKIKYSVKNYFTLLYDYLNGKKRLTDGLSLYINLNEDSFDVLIFKSNEFIYFNSFEINDKNEFLYYLFFIIKNYEISNEKDKIIFLGKYDMYSEYYEIANKYSRLDYITDNRNRQSNIKSPFFFYLNEDNIR